MRGTPRPDPAGPPAAKERRASARTRAVAALALFAAAVAPAACASDGSSFGEPGTPDADRRFYEARCGVCHVPFHRDAFPPQRWPGIVEQFGPRAGLTRSQRERVLRWLTRTLHEDPRPIRP